MSDIAPISRSNAAALSARPASVAGQTTSNARSGQTDKVELSNTARLLSRLSELPDVRQNLVDRVRAEIAAGTYETPDKIEAVLDKIGEDLA